MKMTKTKIGIGIAVVMVVIILGGLIFWKTKKKDSTESKSSESESSNTVVDTSANNSVAPPSSIIEIVNIDTSKKEVSYSMQYGNESHQGVFVGGSPIKDVDSALVVFRAESIDGVDTNKDFVKLSIRKKDGENGQELTYLVVNLVTGLTESPNSSSSGGIL